MNITKRTIFVALFACISFVASGATKTSFNKDWRFYLSPDANSAESFSGAEFDDSQWENVSLPHNAHNEPLLVNDQWQGVCWYRKSFDVKNYSKDQKYVVEFEAAMNHTTIWLNGSAVAVDEGGYLPVVFDATPFLKAEGNVIAVRLDNRDNPTTGPKPLKILDYNMYGGLYRNAWLISSNRAHITHPILANRVASGGVFVTYPEVSKERSVVRIQTHVANENDEAKSLQVVYNIYNQQGEKVATEKCDAEQIARSGNSEFIAEITIDDPNLWSPSTPYLYSVETKLLCGEEVVDSESTRFGIREVKFIDNQMYVNGEKCYLRGVNRHQEYPYIGYALSDNAQYRDAKKIKDAGFDYVRLSHYPHSPAFMAACDELGLFVADAILGWQYYNETFAFKNHCYESARKLIRRDRNHPCVLAWEVSLNETKMPVSFMQRLHDITHEEYPGEGVYTCGWMSDVYDIYFQARQHRIGHPDEMTFEKPYMVSEYGDWEYYSNNAGLNQHKHSREKRIELSSRQLRSAGEKGLLQQAYNLQESHNDNMNIPATGDSYWVMFDYNRGYHKDLEASGVMDIFRLPKFGYYFYQSQSDRQPMVKIASYWRPESATDVKVFSNCDRVKFYLDNHLIGVQRPDQDVNCGNLSHPPFTFKLGEFKEGVLRADGYINGELVASDEVRTPKSVAKLKCWVDESGVAPESGCNDLVFLYIAAVDKHGTICSDFTGEVTIAHDSKVEVLNTDGIKTEAGVATVLLKIGDEKGLSKISATAEKRLRGSLEFEIK